MDLFRSKRYSAHQPLPDERPAKRISTPAGQRLSQIIESTTSRKSKTPASKINVTTTSTYCNDPDHQHIGPYEHTHPALRKSDIVALKGGTLTTTIESSEDRTPNGSNLSVSVWSHKDDAEKFGHIRQNQHRGCGSWWSRKRLAIFAAIAFAVILALAIGLAFGLKKSPGSKPSGDSPSTTGDSQPAGHDSTTSPTDTPSIPAASVAPSALPSDFPAGKFSFVTFLDNVSSKCTGNAATWSCPPDTSYYSDPQKALTVLNWQISGSAGAYKISSNGQDPTLGTMFQNEQLSLLDGGKDTERYMFQFSRAKTVNMTGSIGDQNGDFVCDYSATTVTGYLYTKMAKTYPKDTIATGDTPNPAWPFAARVEQNVGGGENVPACRKKSGEKVTGGLTPQDVGTLCSCMYRNWTPPNPYT